MKINERFLIKSAGSFTVVLDKENPNNVIKINSTAAEILDCVKDGKSEEDIVKYILSTYDIDSEKASEDVAGTVSRFKELGIICD